MPYPRELHLRGDIEEKLVSYLRDELVRHYFERQVMIDELKAWQHDYWAKPSQEKKTFPFSGAANIIIPLTSIAVETIHARTMTTLWAVKPFLSVKARGMLTDYEKPIENWLDYELQHNVKIYKPTNDTILEIEKFGTGVAKSGYENITKKAIRPAPGGREEEIPVVIKRGATMDCVSQARFLMPFSFKDPQTAPWVGEEHSESPYLVKLMEESGLFRTGTYEKLYNWVQQASVGTPPALARQYEREMEKLEHRESHWPRRIDWAEIWAAFDVDGDGTEEEIVIHYHIASQTLMSIRYNWYEDLHRPYRIGVYMPVENRWRGIGIAKQNEQFQKEITTMHRQRLDNATLANMRMFKVHKLSGYGPKEPIFPGKMWFLDDMTHLEPFEISEVYQSAFANEQSTLIYSQQRTGINEILLGMPQVGTPGTATSDMARIQEGNKKFDFVMKNIKMFMGDVCMDIFSNILQFGPRHSEIFQTIENGQLLTQLVNLPIPLIRDSILFEVMPAGQNQNRILDRQNWVQISQLLQQYYNSMLQLAMGQPQLQQLILTKGLTAATEAMKQILESFDVRNIDRILVSEVEGMINAGANGALPNQGGNPVPPNNGGALPGMDLLAKIAALAGGGGAPTTAVVPK